jgi:hypothetical protein
LGKGHFIRYLSMIFIASIISTTFLVVTSNDAAAEIFGDYNFFIDAQGNATITGYSGPGGDIVIPAKMLNGTVEHPVVGIGVGAFYECVSLTTITIPDTIKTIGDYAFYSCSNLTSITIPDSVTYIGTYAFYYCTALTSIVIPNNITSIGYATFSYCFSFTSITIPDNVKTIGGFAFIYCPSLRTITLPESVTAIGERAFFNCASLTSITIPGNVTTIGDYAFSMCNDLTSVSIQDGVSSIGIGAFLSCPSLTSVNIPDSITTIGERAFQKCTSLTSFVLASKVTSIATGAFADCDNMIEMTFLGNAPTCGPDWLSDHNSSLRIYFVNGSSGFTTPLWEGVNTTGINQPDRPQLLQAFLEDKKVIVYWEAQNVPGKGSITGFEVFFGTDQDTSTWTRYSSVNASITNETINGLTPGTTYYFGIKAMNIAGPSPISNTIAVEVEELNISTGLPIIPLIVIAVAFLAAIMTYLISRKKS